MGISLSKAEAGDGALRAVGVFELWKNIVVSTLLGVTALVGAVAVQRYHSGWRTGTFKVEEAECAPPSRETSCSSHGNCNTREVTHCNTVKVDGFHHPFAAAYVSPDAPPKRGDDVKVVFDPKDKDKGAELARNDPIDEYKAWIVAGLVVLALLLGVSAGVQYSVRGSHLAQRTAGVAGVAAAVF